MLYYKGFNDSHVVINRDSLEEAITDALFDNNEYSNYGAAADKAMRIVQSVLDKDAKSILSDLLV